MATSNRMNDVLEGYANIRTIPSYLSAAYLLAGLDQFGSIATVELSWLSYTLSEHTVLISMAAIVVAFAGSTTRRFENYETWEQVAIAVGHVVILGEHLTTEVTGFLIGFGDPLGMQFGFLATVVSQAVANYDKCAQDHQAGDGDAVVDVSTNQSKLGIYNAALAQRSASEVTNTVLDNYLSDTEVIAWTKAE